MFYVQFKYLRNVRLVYLINESCKTRVMAVRYEIVFYSLHILKL